MTQPPVDRLELLYRISQTFNSSLDLGEVLNRVMDEVISATRAERGFLMLYDAEGHLVFRAARGLDHETIDQPEFQVSRGIVERVAQEGEPTLTSDAQSDEWLRERQSVLSLSLRSVLCVPLQIKGEILGVIYVDNRLQAGIFRPDDLELLTAIASSAAIAIENARLYEVAVDKGRMERELQMARELQTGLLVGRTPVVAGWDFATMWQPAREVSGDFYDFPTLDGKELGIVIADVSDKGMGAALFMALSRSIVRASVTGAVSPAEGIARANRLISADAANGMFVTLFYARLDIASGQMTYVNAGHNPPLFYRASQSDLTALTLTGVSLGIDEALPYEQRSVTLAPGDSVLLYTDGVTDALDNRGQEFGEERLRRVILSDQGQSATQLLDGLRQSIAAFTGPTAPFDDITAVAIKRL